jgi:hypothetical protein
MTNTQDKTLPRLEPYKKWKERSRFDIKEAIIQAYIQHKFDSGPTGDGKPLIDSNE